MSMLSEPSHSGSIPVLFRGIARERRDEFVDIDLPPLEDDDDDVEFDDDPPPLLPVRLESCFVCQIEKEVSAKIDFISDISDISDIYPATNAPQWVCESCRRDVYYRIDAYHRIHVRTPSSVEIIHDHDGGIDIDIYISRL